MERPRLDAADTRRLYDIDNARRYVERWKGELRRVPEWGAWIYWDGKRWVPDNCGRAGYYAQLMAPILREANRTDEVPDAQFKRAGISDGLRAMVRHAAESPDIQTSASELDQQLDILNCQNGVVNLRTGELLPHDRKLWMTKIAGCDYDPAALGDKWPKFVSEICSDDLELIRYLRIMAGYSATGETSEQVVFLLHGEGGDGKSTLMELLRAALGDYAGVAAPGLLVQSDRERHPTEIADLVGLRMVSAAEADSDRRLASEVVKMFTGADLMKARRMREDFWFFRMLASFWFLVNSLPVISGGDRGMERRIRVIPFRQYFSDNPLPGELKRNINLLAEIRSEELPAVLNWIVMGAVDWYQSRLPHCAAVIDASQEYLKDQDTFGETCRSLFELVEGWRGCTTRELHQRYREECSEMGDRYPFSEKRFAQELKKRGYSKVKDGDGAMRWLGLNIKGMG